jgi:predicted RNA binding protein YcfA (HicA-like mRNA interferase family)
MPSELPAITGIQLIKLLEKDGWTLGRRAKHGRALTKKIGDSKRVTFIPETRESLPEGTLLAILGAKQTGIGKTGLRRLIGKHGIK